MKNHKLFPVIFTVGFIVCLMFVLFLIPKNNKQIENLVELANPMVGTGGHGHTFPGVQRPFGMVQLSPDTRLDGWDGCSAYHYTDSIIYGFSHTHLSGTGCSDYGDVLFMPMSGDFSYENGSDGKSMGYSSTFSHDSEVAKPGYYKVHLDNPNVDVELTATDRVGLHQYTFQEGAKPYVVVDLRHRDLTREAGIKQVDEYNISGFRRSSAWASDQVIYFYARFSEPIKMFAHHSNQSADGDEFDGIGTDLCAAFGFGDLKENKLFVKVGISSVSIEGAMENLERESKHLDFKKGKSLATSAWNDELSDIIVKGDVEKQKVFYSALYHSYLAPNLFTDVNGNYRGTDLKIHNTDSYQQYTVFSLWDTYRATHPLFTITQMSRTNDFVHSMLNHYQQGGQLPKWELAANYTNCMIGYHAVPVIADAYLKGLGNFDPKLALEAMQHSANMDKEGIPAFASKGYIGVEDSPGSVSKALEYAFDDWCIAQMAKQMGEDEIYNEYIKRAQNYKNHFDPETKMMRARLNGSWFAPFIPDEVNFHYTEANAWQYSFYVPQDIMGWIELLGGVDVLEERLDALFSADSNTSGRHQADITGLIGQYAHGNEPSHHIAYLYNYCGKPWKAQKLLHKIMTEMYTNNPDGYIGNEDCGQMSSWYVMSAMGLYPVNPASGIYDIGTPMFDTITIQMENGQRFSVFAQNLSDENIYVQSVTLNGNAYDKLYVKHEDIVNGGEINFVMGSTPNEKLGSAQGAIYESRIDADDIVVSPVMMPANRSFVDSVAISIEGIVDEGVKVYYTLDGSMPDANSTLYTEPFVTDKAIEVKAVAIKGDKKSGVVMGEYNKIDANVALKLDAEYSNQYNGGGDKALIDGIRGGGDYRTGEWQGYEGQDLEAVVDLGSVKDVNHIGAGFLQDIKSWIWMPSHVEFYIAGPNKQFKLVGEVSPKSAEDLYGTHIENLEIAVEGKVQYIKMKAKTYGEIPEWHLGAGGQAWIFADEIYWN